MGRQWLASEWRVEIAEALFKPMLAVCAVVILAIATHWSAIMTWCAACLRYVSSADMTWVFGIPCLAVLALLLGSLVWANIRGYLRTPWFDDDAPVEPHARPLFSDAAAPYDTLAALQAQLDTSRELYENLKAENADLCARASRAETQAQREAQKAVRASANYSEATKLWGRAVQCFPQFLRPRVAQLVQGDAYIDENAIDGLFMAWFLEKRDGMRRASDQDFLQSWKADTSSAATLASGTKKA